MAYANAPDTYRLARADFQAKRGLLTTRLLLFCEPGPGDLCARLDAAGNLLLIDRELSRVDR
jgi:hypothetical protein